MENNGLEMVATGIETTNIKTKRVDEISNRPVDSGMKPGLSAGEKIF